MFYLREKVEAVEMGLLFFFLVMAMRLEGRSYTSSPGLRRLSSFSVSG